LQDESDPVLPSAAPFLGVDTEHLDPTLVGRLIALEDLNRRRLARAVLAQEAEDRTAFDAEGHVVHGGERTESLGESRNLYDVAIESSATCSMYSIGV